MKIIRKHKAISFELEKKILDALAEKLHPYLCADQLTLIGLLGVVLTASSYWYANYNLNYLHLANLGIFFNWFGDSLDGRTARMRHENRPNYGHYLDHLIDSIAVVIASVGIVFSGLTQGYIWLMVLVVYLLLMIHTFLKANVTGVFELSMGRVGPTEARIMVIVINLIILYAGNPILVTRPLRFNLADLMGVCTFLTLFQVYLRAVFSSLFGKNKIKEDND